MLHCSGTRALETRTLSCVFTHVFLSASVCLNYRTHHPFCWHLGCLWVEVAGPASPTHVPRPLNGTFAQPGQGKHLAPCSSCAARVRSSFLGCWQVPAMLIRGPACWAGLWRSRLPPSAWSRPGCCLLVVALLITLVPAILPVSQMMLRLIVTIWRCDLERRVCPVVSPMFEWVALASAGCQICIRT